ncbi:MAG: transposase family protein [Planctomycetota bacterium]|nr:transposase family protein [Planctomycetota bacterium]
MSVEFALKQDEVHVHLSHESGRTWRCPECDRECPPHDHQPERVLRHLVTCQYRALMHAALPRTSCPAHGVKVVRVPWAEPHSHFTMLFEGLVIEWLQAI